MHECRSAPRTAEETKAIVSAEIEQLASRGTPDLFSVLERGAGAIGWPQHQISAPVTGTAGVAHAAMPDTLALFTWLHRDMLLARIKGEIDSISDDAHALTVEQRAESETSILGKILDAERSECFHIEQAASEGGEIAVRPETDVRAFLGVEGPSLEDY